MGTTGLRLQFSLVIVIGFGVGVAPTARSGDIAGIVVDLVRPLETGAVTTVNDCLYQGFCAGNSAIFSSDVGLTALAGFDLESLSSVTSGVVNDRIVPLSSSVSGFTYDYNPDLDVYDRSTKTFGPLFS